MDSYPWYLDDWWRSEAVAAMNLAERGLYRELLDHCWQKGSLPTDKPTLVRLARVDSRDFAKAWPAVARQFVERDGRFWNEKVNQKRPGIASAKESRSASAAKAATARWRHEQPPSNGGAKPSNAVENSAVENSGPGSDLQGSPVATCNVCVENSNESRTHSKDVSSMESTKESCATQCGRNAISCGTPSPSPSPLATLDTDIAYGSSPSPSGDGADAFDLAPPGQPPPDRVTEATRAEWFEAMFWPAVWAKIGKAGAKAAFIRKARTLRDAQRITDAAKQQGPDLMGQAVARAAQDGGQVRPIHPETWLNKGRYEDEPMPTGRVAVMPKAAQRGEAFDAERDRKFRERIGRDLQRDTDWG